jgi:arylsulfatase A
MQPTNITLKTSTHFNCPARLFIFIFLSTLLFSCAKEKVEKIPSATGADKSLQVKRAGKPNIVFILADDIGYEIPNYTGGQSYSTPNINTLAQNSMQFTQCQAAPNCSPSRVMLMTGKYNFRNYIDWGILDTSQHTIANLLHDHGYATCVAGKWQLDGGDTAIRKFGFDAYRVFLPFTPKEVSEENAENWYRYKNPHIYENGAYLPDSATLNKYSDDMFVDYISNFIDSNINNPFFVYYPMSLCHPPMCPPPNHPDYATWTPESHRANRSYFPYMVEYMDEKVGQVVQMIVQKGLAANTIIIFVGDNGTASNITSMFQGKLVTGGKGTTTQYATHVPFLISWPGYIAPGIANNNLINFPDFMPTLADIIGARVPNKWGTMDGISFYPSLTNVNDTIRKWGFCYWKQRADAKLYKWDQTVNYKLYDTVNKGKFYNLLTDTLEQHPVANKDLTPEERQVKKQLRYILNQMHN